MADKHRSLHRWPLAIGRVAFELFDAGGDLALERDDVLDSHSGERAFVVAGEVRLKPSMQLVTNICADASAITGWTCRNRHTFRIDTLQLVV